MYSQKKQRELILHPFQDLSLKDCYKSNYGFGEVSGERNCSLMNSFIFGRWKSTFVLMFVTPVIYRNVQLSRKSRTIVCHCRALHVRTFVTEFDRPFFLLS